MREVGWVARVLLTFAMTVSELITLTAAMSSMWRELYAEGVKVAELLIRP